MNKFNHHRFRPGPVPAREVQDVHVVAHAAHQDRHHQVAVVASAIAMSREVHRVSRVEIATSHRQVVAAAVTVGVRLKRPTIEHTHTHTLGNRTHISNLSHSNTITNFA